tara:strand:+ start:1212 stop:1760 length:549 start_codon:yes stop_codon:yes gene_type:complete
MALVTWESIYTYLKIAEDSDDKDLLVQMEVMISAEVEAYCKAFFKATTITDETHDGDGEAALFLEHRPVISVTTLYIGENVAADLVAADDYEVYNDVGKIYYSGLFSVGQRNVIVTYVTGFTNVPRDIVRIILQLIAKEYRGLEKEGFKSERIGSYSYALADDEFSANQLNTLERYMQQVVI